MEVSIFDDYDTTVVTENATGFSTIAPSNEEIFDFQTGTAAAFQKD